MNAERQRLQTLLAFAYGLQLGRQRRLSAELHRLANTALLASMASGAAIAVSSGDRIECIARAGDVAPQLGSRPESGLSGECIRTGTPLLCADTQADIVVESDSRTSEVRSVAYVPLFRGVQPAGVLGVFSEVSDHFTEHDVRILRLIGRDVTKLLKWEAATPILPSAPTSITRVTSAEYIGRDAIVLKDTTDGARVESPEDVPKPGSPEMYPSESTGSDESAALGTQVRLSEDLAAVEFASFDSSDSGGLSRAGLYGGIVLGIVLLLGAGWWMTMRPKAADPYPMVYGPPQVTDDSPVRSSAQSAIAVNEAASVPVARVSRVAAIPERLAQIKAVTTQSLDGHTFVTVYLSGPARFQAHQLKGPDRIYVDFEGVELSPDIKKRKLDASGAIAEYRLAKSSGNAARFVMVLAKQCSYLVSETSDPYVVVFDVQPRP